MEETMSDASKIKLPFPKIEILPEHVIDQIKAGEVIERPASLLKEVIENSLDAHSSRIDVEIKNNGLDLIGIEDDGDGIEYSQLPFAFCRHATSKIQKFDDIYSLSSYGFRGEALASAAGIARIHCTSTPLPPYKGGKYVVHGGREMEHSPCASTGHGTSLFIRDLFYNTPARLKFIKSKTAEKNAISKILYSFIINNSGVTFTLKWDDGEKRFFPAVGEDHKVKRIGRAFYGEKKSQKVLEACSEYGEYRMEIFISPETTKSAATRRQFLFINGRAVEDKGLHYAVTKGLPSLWQEGLCGHYCIFVSVPPDEIDVNAHPNKTTVRLFRTDVVYSLAKSTVHKIDQTAASKTEARMPAEQPRFAFRPTDEAGPETVAPASWRPRTTAPSSARPKTSHEDGRRQINIHPDVSLVAIDERFYLVNRQRLLGEIVKDFLRSASEGECRNLPLLVGEPIPFDHKLQGKVEYLKELGFDIDRLDESLLTVKAFPAALSGTPFLELVRSFLASNDDAPPDETLLCLARSMAFGEADLYRYLGERATAPFRSVKPVDDDLVRTIFS